MAKYGSDDGRWFVRPTSLPTLNFHQFDPHVRFSKAGPYSNHGYIHHIAIEDEKTGDTMGDMGWLPSTGEITGIRTQEPFRRLGVANTLFHEAKNIAREQGLAEPVHSADRSDMGEAWAKSAGGDMPKRLKLQ